MARTRYWLSPISIFADVELTEQASRRFHNGFELEVLHICCERSRKRCFSSKKEVLDFTKVVKLE